MQYDFEGIIDRYDLASSKWEGMKALRPTVSRGVVPFSVADMEFANPPQIVEGLKQYLEKTILGYAAAHDPEYLRVVCGWMKKRHDWEIRPEWICNSPGVVSAFFWAIQAFSDPGDGVIVQTPVYYPFFNAINRNGRKLVRNPLILDGDRYIMDFEDLERKARDPRTKILLFCSPHNPVGRVWTREELGRVGDICLRNGVFIISDEIHFDLVMPGHRHTVFATLSPELADNMMVCTAPSKTFNIAGLKTSNIILSDAKNRQRFIAQTERNGFSSLCLLGYEACKIAYSQCEDWLEAALAVMYKNHLELKKFMASHIPEIKVFDLEGTYLQWMDFRGLGLESEKLETMLHDEAELFFDEGGIFGEEAEGFERMNIACPTSVMMDGLFRLEKMVRRRRP